MDTDILGEVIKVEKEIQANLEQERVKAREWLEKKKLELQRELENAQQVIQEARSEHLDALQQEAEAAGAATLKRAEQDAHRLTQLSDDTLMRIIEKHLRSIVPG